MYVCIWDLGSVPCNHVYVYALQKKKKNAFSYREKKMNAISPTK